MEDNNNHCDYDNTDDERAGRWLKKKGLDIKTFEINSCRQTLKRSVEDPNLGKPPEDKEYLIFLKSLLFESEPSSSLNYGDDDNDEKDDMDPQYMMFLENLKEDGRSYKLEIPTKNRIVSVMYEEEDASDDEYDMQFPVKVKKILKKKTAEAEENQNIRNNTGRVRDDEMKKKHSKSEAAKYMVNTPSRDQIETRKSLRICNVMMDSRKILRNSIGGTQNFRGDLSSRELKKYKNLPIGMKVETHRSLRSGMRKHVEYTRMDMKNNRGREKGKSMEAENLKSKRANHSQAKMYERSGKKSRAKGDGLFGSDFQHELNDDDDDIDECYRIFLKSVKVEGDCVVSANEGQNPVKLEEFDVECGSDCEILVATNASEFNEGGYNPFQTTKLIVTPENKQLCLRSGEGEIESGFRKKLMAKLGEPYDDEEYFKLWDEINEEKPKMIHRDLRGSGVMKQFASDELSPSYLTKYAPLKRKIASANPRKRLSYLRAFFFWLQNVAHQDAFQPLFDKSCLELMEKGC